MPAFRPCIAVTKAKINGTAIRDGQLIVVVETGELFFDYGGQRIALVQGSGDGTETEEESDPLLCCVVNADTRLSSSIQGGGGSFVVDESDSDSDSDGGDDDSGLYHPQPVTPSCQSGIPVWAIFLDDVAAEATSGGGGPHSGLTADMRPGNIQPEFDGSSMIFAVFHGNQ